MKILWIMLAWLLLSMNAYADQTHEKWVIEYSFTDGKKLPQAYIDISIVDGVISGIATDLSNDKASVSGSVKGITYKFVIHPIKHGDDTSQDIEFVGIKKGAKISGQWSHAIGPRGIWSAYKTSKSAESALKNYKNKCIKVEQAQSGKCA